MPQRWFDLTRDGQTRRVLLQPGLTRIGSAGCEIEVATAGADQLHVWDDPPKVVFVGKGARPMINGSQADERALFPGDRLRWGGAELVFGAEQAAPVLVEVTAQEAAARALPEREARAWKRVKAGLLFEMGVVDRAVARRWQEAVLAGRFEPDACAEELLATGNPAAAKAALERLPDRGGTLLRDLIMAPYQRGTKGAARAVRGVARHGLAYFVSQIVILVLFAVLFGAVLVLLRHVKAVSVDGWIDGLLSFLGLGAPAGR